MLKKVAFVLALTVLASCALALTSGPSNTVGFVKTTVTAGAYTPFGLAFTYWDVVGGVPAYNVQSTKPSDIVGTQITCDYAWMLADQVIRQDNGSFAIRNLGAPTACDYTGVLETDPDPDRMDVGRAYNLWNKQAADYDIVLAGQVDTSAYGPINCPGGAYTPLSFRDARVRPIPNINLQTSGGFQGDHGWLADQLIDQISGDFAVYNSDAGPAWVYTPVTFTDVEPGKAYMIFNRHTTFDYYYGPGLVAPPPERPGNNDGSIDRITRPTRRSRSLR